MSLKEISLKYTCHMSFIFTSNRYMQELFPIERSKKQYVDLYSASLGLNGS